MADVDYFLKIDDIPGESSQGGHKDEIEVHSFSWGETNAGSHAGNAGGGAGKVQMQDFSFKMTTNKASPKLFLACATGKAIKTALLTARKAGGKQHDYLKVKFSDLLISSFHIGGSPGEVIPSELITFNFSKIEYSYAPQKPDGSLGPFITSNYDLKTSAAA